MEVGAVTRTGCGNGSGNGSGCGDKNRMRGGGRETGNLFGVALAAEAWSHCFE